ncbi:DUF2306 domain-containing protein [Novosphingobium panipatense]|uniref:Uncharacterized membrane protein n=2 Tax=Novosphingobium panipatense TaxID=428991 RepID=A0ABY1Q461_9SPHN|nr:DUF2306 domain-containing protein [Novosphingobium panipatense]SMP57698.1 Uncharacterized membrane protein [Novosphingobium panipatense]
MNILARSRIAGPDYDRRIVIAGAIAGGAILLALIQGLAGGAAGRSSGSGFWLTLHLLSVIPALPVGAYVLLRRKGDKAHRTAGRIWGGLMMVAALSSFGLPGGLGLIHGLSVLVLVMIPRGILQARRGNIAAHRRTMSLTYLSLAVAGMFTLLPGRLLGSWLFG